MTPSAAAEGQARGAVPSSQAHVTLETEVQFLRGVGPVRAREFEGLGVTTVGDLIEYFPFRHELRPKSIAIGHLELGKVATIVGELRRVRTHGYARRATMNATCMTRRVNVASAGSILPTWPTRFAMDSSFD